MKLCMVAASLAGGGAERALLDTAALLADRGHEISVLTFDDGTSDAYAVPGNVEKISLGLPVLSGNRLRGIWNNLRRIGRLRRAIKTLNPEVVVSYLTRANIICLLALLGTGTPVVATEHNVASLKDAPMQGLWRTLRRQLYRRMAGVVVVSKGLAREYSWVRKGKLSVIYNFLPPARGFAPESFNFVSPDFHHIVAMGRLEPEKGFDKLIKAFHLIHKDCPDWKLLIAGEGSLRPQLTDLISSLGLTERVVLPGWVNNPRTLFSQCDLFALSSASEGFGLVLVEAMSTGLPVVSFDCDFGPREIITQGVSGTLVPAGNVPALSRAIKKLANDDAERTRLARNGVAAARRFAPHEILYQWEMLLRHIVGTSTTRENVHRHTQADPAR